MAPNSSIAWSTVGLLVLRKIARSHGKYGRPVRPVGKTGGAKTVLSEREVSIDTSKEEKQFAAAQIWPGDEGVLCKSSIIRLMIEINKDAIPTKLLWVDLEMTGLDVTKDVIIEVAAEITDFEFKTLASYEAIITQTDETLGAMNDWSHQHHTQSGLIDKIRTIGRPETEVVHELVGFIGAQFGDEPAILAGNSIHNDRSFIKQCWPEVEALLHYRMLDVSAWKIIMQAKYGVMFEKKEVHRAFEDIQASIAELQFYLAWFKGRNES